MVNGHLDQAYSPPPIRPRPSSIMYATAPSSAPIQVISNPLLHHDRIVIRDFAAPTAKCAASETIAATITAGIPVIKKNGMIGIKAPTAVDKAPETAATIGFLNPSSVVLSRSLASALTSCSLSCAM